MSFLEIMSNYFLGTSNKTDSIKLQKKDQIPTEFNEEQTRRAIRKQDRISGERREKTINDFPYTAAIAQALTGLHFPANKKNIIEYVQHKQSIKADGDEILSVLQQIQEKNYDTVADVTRSAGLVE